jgi:hypothetical protein
VTSADSLQDPVNSGAFALISLVIGVGVQAALEPACPSGRISRRD